MAIITSQHVPCHASWVITRKWQPPMVFFPQCYLVIPECLSLQVGLMHRASGTCSAVPWERKRTVNCCHLTVPITHHQASCQLTIVRTPRVATITWLQLLTLCGDGQALWYSVVTLQPALTRMRMRNQNESSSCALGPYHMHACHLAKNNYGLYGNP